MADKIEVAKSVYERGFHGRTSYYVRRVNVIFLQSVRYGSFSPHSFCSSLKIMTEQNYLGEMYNDFLLAEDPDWINKQVMQGDWRLHWGPLDSGVRTPFHTLAYNVKAKEMLHNWEMAMKAVQAGRKGGGE